MFSTVYSGAFHGIDSYITAVEVDVSGGLPSFELVGFLGSEIREARERVKVAMKNSGFVMDPAKIIVNISPANIRKEGTQFDLPIAVGILASLGFLPQENLKKVLIMGELGLNGEVKFVSGILPVVMEAKEKGLQTCIIPEVNVAEGAVVEGIEMIGVADLKQVVQYFTVNDINRTTYFPPASVCLRDRLDEEPEKEFLDFCDLNGQEGVRRAVEIAAAGFHHLLIIGPPGSGKTMVAKRLPSVLPPMSVEESLEVSKIYSVSGMLNEENALIVRRPFRNPHHTISEQALAGGGRIPRPGVISLAHRGVLFLDEVVHFSGAAIEVLRQPLEDRQVQISRNYGTYTYPADFMLVAAMNPCPCGYYPDRNRCNCTEKQVKKYVNKISGPILDRIDICIRAPRMEAEQLHSTTKNESSETIRKRVMKARSMQEKRFAGTSFRFNSELGPAMIDRYIKLENEERIFADEIYAKLDLSARSYHRMIKVARTIADLAECETIKTEHLAEAAGYRGVFD